MIFQVFTDTGINGNPPNGSPKLGCLCSNPLSGGPELLHFHDCPGYVLVGV